MNEWSEARWEGGSHDGLVQRFKSDDPLPEWRTCECHGVAYRYSGVVGGAHILVPAHQSVTEYDAIARFFGYV